MIVYTTLPIGKRFRSSKLVSNREMNLSIAVYIVVLDNDPLLNILILSTVNVRTKQLTLLI